jgi:hypothetical protein
MREDIENWNALLVRLKHSLQALAMSADVQLDLFPNFVCKVEELALDFDHWGLCVLDNDEGELSQEQRALLIELNSAFDKMIGVQNQHLWTEDALHNNPEWQGVREIAKATLASFGWNIDRPPSYKQEYVPGANI